MVTKVINTMLADTQPHVHARPLSVVATPVSRKASAAPTFQLRCDVCKHHMCTWRATAAYDASEQRLHVYQYKAGQHGEVWKASTRGRKRVKDAPQLPPVVQRLTYAGAKTQEGLHKFVGDYFENQPLSDSLWVRCKPRKETRLGLTCAFSCSTPWNRESRAPTATCRAQFWCGFAHVVHVCMRLSCLARSRGGSVRQPSGSPTNAHRLFLNVLLSCPRCTAQTKPPVLHGLQPSKVLCTVFARRREPKGFRKYQPRIAGRMMLLISSSSRAAAMRPCRKMPGSHLPQTSCGETTQSCASSTCTCPLPCCACD